MTKGRFLRNQTQEPSLCFFLFLYSYWETLNGLYDHIKLCFNSIEQIEGNDNGKADSLMKGMNCSTINTSFQLRLGLIFGTQKGCLVKESSLLIPISSSSA